MQKTYDVTIAPNGKVQIEAKGFEGKECTDATSWLEKLLGRITGRKKKKEFYKTAKTGGNQLKQS